jgi:hypothetical protein
MGFNSGLKVLKPTFFYFGDWHFGNNFSLFTQIKVSGSWIIKSKPKNYDKYSDINLFNTKQNKNSGEYSDNDCDNYKMPITQLN